MNKVILAIGFIFLQSIVYSQDKIIIEGKIVADSLENSRINILNITKNIGTTNSNSGDFKIEVQKNDTLLFSSVQYENIELKVSEADIARRFLKVILKKRIIDLDEIIVKKFNLTGNLNQDIEEIKIYDYYKSIPTSKIPRLTHIGRQLYTARDGDIDPLLNMISGRLQMLENAKKIEQLTFDVQEVMDAIDSSVFTDEFQIPEDEIINFVYYCAESSSFKKLVENDQYLDLIELFRKKASAFRELREIKLISD